MWVRVDAKLDTLVSRQQHFDVELALLKERTHQQEAALAAHDEAERRSRELLAKEIKTAESEMGKAVQDLKDGQVTLGSALRWATATVIGASILVDALIRIFR